MPLAERTIEPIYLGRRPLKGDETGENIVLVAVAHNAVLGALVQLASLVRHADDLFCDLADECQSVFEKTERIIQKVRRVKDGIGQLESKKVKIPVGDLKLFSTVQDHHTARHGFDCTLFAPDSRPHCIKARYSMCDVTPAGALRGADLYRKDGLHGSDLFKLWPIILQEHKVRTPDLNLPRRRAKTMTFNKKYKQLTPKLKTAQGTDGVSIDNSLELENKETEGSNLSHLSKSQPSILVAVDTSGINFQRMSSLRQSQKGTMSLDRKKRRRTVSGIPGNIMQEIEQFEKDKKTLRNTPRPYSFDDIDVDYEPKSDEIMKQYLDELDAKIEERVGQERASRESKLLKFLPCRRSRSLPRCVKIGSSQDQTQGQLLFEQDEPLKDKDRSMIISSSGYASSTLSLGSAGSSTSVRASKRSSIISNKIKSFVQGTLRPRPKSLDFDTIDVLGSDEEHEEDNLQRGTKLKRKLSPSMPDDIMSLTTSRESKVGPGTYYYFESNTLPLAQARKYDFPWDSLPKDWTTAVKLREISKRRHEERNSSSGNWSGSSNRQSLDSARSSNLPPSASQHSLGRDSGRDSVSIGDDKSGTDTGYHADQTSTDSTTSSFRPPPTESSSIDKDTEEWLHSLAQRAAAREDVAEAGCDITESLTRLSELTRQNIQALDSMSPGFHRPLRLDDEVSSVYSLDQEGFYTSFHNDSGLRRSTGTLLDNEDTNLTPVKEANSMLSMGSTNTIDSVIFRPNGAAGAQNTSCSLAAVEGSQKVRPPPPPRTSSISSNSSLLEGKSGSFGSLSTATSSSHETKAGEDVSQSESDQETIYARLKVKTHITSRTFPSWCSISDEDSTDSSNMCLIKPSLPQNGAFVSVSGSPAIEGASTKSPSIVGSTTPLGNKIMNSPWRGSTLPQHFDLESKLWEEDLPDHANSWPRSRRSQPTAGILKRDKSPAGTMKNKTLNFAPLVSLFDQHTPEGIEIPLQLASSPSSEDCESDDIFSNTFSYKLPLPNSDEAKSQVDIKYQPTFMVTPGKFTKTSNSKMFATPNRRVSAGNVMQSTPSDASESSMSSSASSIPSLSDSGHGGHLSTSSGRCSIDTLSSGSTTGLSDSSFTYVSASSNNSTPTNSTLTLSDPLDTPTPVNSPVFVHDGHRISSFHDTHKNDSQTLLLSSNKMNLERGSLLTEPVIPSQTSFCPQGNGTSLEMPNSFPSSAKSKAFSATHLGAKLAEVARQNRVSVDSGFSSPTTPTISQVEHQQQQQELPPSSHKPKSNHHHHHHHHHHHGKQSHVLKLHHNSHGETNNTGYGDNVSAVDGIGNNTQTKYRTSAPPVHLPLGQKHEPFLGSDSIRTDSYRIAMTTTTKSSGPHVQQSADIKVQGHKSRSKSSTVLQNSAPNPLGMTKSMSCPAGVMVTGDVVNRADSYRLAVRNTQGIVGDVATRNTSYRLATHEDDPVPDDRMDAIISWDSNHKLHGRDVRRMGITDIDQLKCYENDGSKSSRMSVPAANAKGSSKGFAGISSSRKKMRPEVDNLLRGDKTPSPEVKLRSKSRKSSKERPQSSTYIRFDPIFEDQDSMYSSNDTLRADSVELLPTDNGFLMSHKIVSQLPPGKLKASGGKKAVDEKAVMSILDSIKTTIKSMSGKQSVDKDMWRYEGGI